MGSVPTPRTFVAGEIESAAYLNSLAQVISFLQNPPRVKAYATAIQSIPNGAYTNLNFQAELWDTDGMHSTTTNIDRLTCQTPGLYLVEGMATWQGSSTVGLRYGVLQRNGGTPPGGDLDSQSQATGAALQTMRISEEVQLAAGDYLQFAVYQSSGGAMNIQNGAGVAASLGARWVAIS